MGAERLRSTRAPVVVQMHEELPHSETGKLLRRVLREELPTLHGSRSERRRRVLRLEVRLPQPAFRRDRPWPSR